MKWSNKALIINRSLPMFYCCFGSIARCLVLVCLFSESVAFSEIELQYYREKTKAMFYHGMNGYLEHAFPLDELRPLSCTGVGLNHLRRTLDKSTLLDYNNSSFEILTGIAMTLIDAMDTLIFIENPSGFHQLVKLFLDTVVSFNIDNTILVFELNIRVLGGLLSCHLFLAGLLGEPEAEKFKLPGYKGQMLDLAKDLGSRLLPAFNSHTGIPYSKVNLRTGLELGSNTSNCPAAAGTFILEFGLLSLLTGEPIYYAVAKKSMKEIWKRRSAKNLIGGEIDINSGEWLDPASTIGAGSDSFYEYLLKGYIMFGDKDLLQMFDDSMKAINDQMLDQYRVFYKTVHFGTGSLRTDRIDALGAFYPGLQVLRGDTDGARRAFDGYYLMFRKHGGFLPECVSVDHRITSGPSYNLRPELAESAYYLYQATKDPFYLRVGAEMLEAIDRFCRTSCGFTVIDDLFVGSLGDRMESFLLSETLKYLYLLFNPDHWVNKLTTPAVFSTGKYNEVYNVSFIEAHFLMVPRKIVLKSVGGETFSCPLISYESQRLIQQRLIAHWHIGFHSQSMGDFQRIWSTEKLNDFSDITPAFNASHLEIDVPIHHYLVFLSGKICRYSVMKLQPWFDLKKPGYIVSQLGGSVMSGLSNVVLLQRRKRLENEVLLSARFGRKSYPFQMIQRHFDQCREEFDLGKTPKFFGLVGKDPDNIQDLVIPNKLWAAYRKSGLTESKVKCGKANLRAFSIDDVVETFMDSESQSVLNFANFPVVNLHMVKVPDYIYDELL